MYWFKQFRCIYLLLRFAYSGVLLMTAFLKIYPIPKIRNIPIYRLSYSIEMYRIATPVSWYVSYRQILANTHSPIRFSSKTWACSLSTLVQGADRYANATSASAGKRLLFVCQSLFGICFSVLVSNVSHTNYMLANDYNVVYMRAATSRKISWKKRKKKKTVANRGSDLWPVNRCIPSLMAQSNVYI